MAKATKLQQRIANRAARAAGPAFVGQIMSSVVEDDDGGKHEIVFLPDKNNPDLRDAGKPMHFYFLPQTNRLARHSGGDFVFGVQRFSGIMDPSKNIGEDGFSELAGGVMNFTATLAPPPGVVEKAFEKVKEQLQLTQNKHYFWQKNTPIVATPAPVALRSNETVLHSLNYKNSDTGQDGAISDNPDAWAFEIQGTGAGTLNIMATNAYTVMMGRRPIELVWGAAKKGTSPLTLENHISYDVWTVPYTLKIVGDWEKIRTHFSASVEGQYAWFKASASHEVNKLMENGAITVDITVGAGMDMELRQKIDMAADSIITSITTMVMDKMKQAGTTLDEEVDGAEAQEHTQEKKKKRKWWSPIQTFKVGLSVAVKNRKDVFQGSFTYEKRIEEQVTRSEVISAQMEGVFDEIKADETNLDRYFTEVFMEEGFRKVHVVTSAIANWPENQIGDPIHSLKVQIGYPDSNGQINWKPSGRVLDGPTDVEMSGTTIPAIWVPGNKDARFIFDFTRHGDRGDDSEKIWVRKTIAFKESPDVAINEVVEEYETDAHTIDVRAESSGQLLVGPINIDMVIPDADKQIDVIVHVRTPKFGEKAYRFNGSTAAAERYYKVWYAKPEDLEDYEYKVEATVKGKRFGQKSVRWEGDWTTGSGNGPLTVEIPAPPDALNDKLDTYLS
ncbi:hypothetical protein [Pseudosulfitobacter sp. SM2401]|uniref:hypothetical protein n=1 Tax=Pseudosulfitobacter sp. SM2401 TaxID=3350098 RepID=UPI0036F339F0